MTDKTPTRRQHDADTMTDRDVVSPTVAAQRLGVTPDAVRARLRRGTLAGEQIAGEWRVFLPRDTTSDDEARDAQHDADTTPTVDRHDGDTTAPDRTQELIDAQREEIAFLRGQLEHSRRELSAERERFDVIHREALGRIEALTATLVETEPPDEDDSLFYGAEKPEKPPTSPETRDVAPGRADPLDVSPGSNEPDPNAGRSVFEDLWRWIRGR